MTLGFDIDGVMANFNGAYANLLAAAHGLDLLRSRDAEVFTSWDWDRDSGYTQEVIDRVWKHDIHGSDKFWTELEMMPDAYGALWLINKLANGGHDVYFITNRHGLMAKQQTERWLHTCGMDRPTVLLAEDKVHIIRDLRMQLYVDDRLETMAELYKVSAEEGWLEKKLFILKDAAYNRAARPEGMMVATNLHDALSSTGLVQSSYVQGDGWREDAVAN